MSGLQSQPDTDLSVNHRVLRKDNSASNRSLIAAAQNSVKASEFFGKEDAESQNVNAKGSSLVQFNQHEINV